MSRNTVTPCAENLHLALFDGSVFDVQHILDASKKSPRPQPPSARAHFELLQAQCRPQGNSGLFMALQNGHAETVEIFTQWVLNADDKDLSKNDKFKLLAAHMSDGTQGLFMALQNGHATTVEAFTVCLLNANDHALSKIDKVKLLTAHRHNGTPGLFVAFHNGHTDTVITFTQCILNAADLHLSKADKINLLTARSGDGISGLLIALRNGFLETAKAFEASIQASVLDEASKATLLSEAEGIRGPSEPPRARQGSPQYTSHTG